MNECKYAVLGVENIANLRLSNTLRRVYGPQNVGRFLELQHLEPYLVTNEGAPIVVCLDLFGFDLSQATKLVGYVRDRAFPKVVFNLFVDQKEYRERSGELPGNWQLRFQHYYKTYKEDDDVDFEPILRASLRSAQYEAVYNISHEPVRLTPAFKKGMIEASPEKSDQNDPVAFVSYSRYDWDGFVSGLVSDLNKASQTVWVDRDYILGGDDWLDAIGEALNVCDILLLVLSPEAIASRNVRTEYRYFFKQEKPIVPIMYRQVDLPFELATIHNLDFTTGGTNSFEELLRILEQQRKPG